MSGHSKWSKVKHQKAVTDVAKAANFTRASRAITIAVKEGGGVADPNTNFRLRLAVEKAREANVPNENIKRAIAKAKEKDQEKLEEVLYEAYGPGTIAILIEGATDNTNRTVAAVKSILDHNGGRLVSPGAIQYLFRKVGLIVVSQDTAPYDSLFEQTLESGATDIRHVGDVYEIYTEVTSFFQVRAYFDHKNIPIITAKIIFRPETTVKVSKETIAILESLEEQLSELADVQQVYTNAAEDI